MSSAEKADSAGPAKPAADAAQAAKLNNFDHLPQELRSLIAADVPLEQIHAAAQYDLKPGGEYMEGCLVLADGRLGDFVHRDGQWQAPQWMKTSELGEAKIVEGLGMGLLRLLKDGKTAGEFRFTLRHAKAVARLQRRLERKIEGKEETPEDVAADQPKPDEKKVRCEKCDRVIPPWSEVCPACLSRRKILSRLLDFVGPYKWRAAAGAAMAVLITIMGLVQPWLTMPMIDKGLGLPSGKYADYGTLMFYVAIWIALMFGRGVGDALKNRLLAALASRVGRDVRNKTYEHMHKLSLSFFSKKPTGSLVTRITSDTDRIWDFVAFTVIDMAMSILTVAGVCVALFLLNWRLAFFVLLPIPIMATITIVFHNRLHRVFDRLWHRWSQMTSVVSDALPGVRVIKAFGQEKREVDRFGRKNQQFYEDEVGSIMLWTLFGPMLQLCSQIGAIIVWVVGGYWAIKYPYWVTPGTLLTFVGYMWMFYGPIHMLAHMDRALNRAAASVQRVFEVLDTQPAIFTKAEARADKQLQGRIELRDVSFSYDGIRKVLKNVSFQIEPGQMVGLAGPSGGGKSTLINLICRFYDVLEGSILIDGVDVRDYDLTSLRRQVGVVLQEPFLFHGTVGQNIAYGHPEATLEDIITASRAANAHDFIVGFPDGYDTMVGERGHTLSGGERQRISIARAILNNPRVLILDEATSSVDTETEKLIQEALDRLVANRTTIAIAHRLSTLRKADRLVVLEQGEIKEMGSHDELANKEDGLYAKLLKLQTEMQSIIAIGA